VARMGLMVHGCPISSKGGGVVGVFEDKPFLQIKIEIFLIEEK